MSDYNKLKMIFTRLSDLGHMKAIAHWDEAVMMPLGGGPVRAQALSTVEAISHEMLTSKEVSRALARAEDEELNETHKMNLHWMKRAYIKASCLPTELIEQHSLLTTRCEQAWRVLRAKNDWDEFKPLLEQVLDSCRLKASIQSDALAMSPYDVLLDEHSPGLSQAVIEPMFNELEDFLPDFISHVIARQKTQSTESISGQYSIDKQKELAVFVMQNIGFDF